MVVYCFHQKVVFADFCKEKRHERSAWEGGRLVLLKSLALIILPHCHSKVQMFVDLFAKSFLSVLTTFLSPHVLVRRIVGEHFLNQLYCVSKLPEEWRRKTERSLFGTETEEFFAKQLFPNL